MQGKTNVLKRGWRSARKTVQALTKVGRKVIKKPLQALGSGGAKGLMSTLAKGRNALNAGSVPISHLFNPKMVSSTQLGQMMKDGFRGGASGEMANHIAQIPVGQNPIGPGSRIESQMETATTLEKWADEVGQQMSQYIPDTSYITNELPGNHVMTAGA